MKTLKITKKGIEELESCESVSYEEHECDIISNLIVFHSNGASQFVNSLIIPINHIKFICTSNDNIKLFLNDYYVKLTTTPNKFFNEIVNFLEEIWIDT